jgi:predicted lactoylglutathione lyase
MELSVSCVTLVVPDVAAASRFYAALGFLVRERGPVAYLGSAGTPAIALATSETLAAVGLAAAPSAALLACNLANATAVETLFERAIALGGTALAAPHAVPYGIAAWLQDPFGHRWEFVWNPAKNPVGTTPPSAQ